MKRTLVDLFENSVKQYPDNPFLWEKTTNKFEPTTYTQVREQVYTLGAGLVALGVMKGDNMALLSEGRNAWIIGELAMFYAGATNVPLSIKLEEANDLLFRLTHADVKYIMVSGNQLKKIRSIVDKLPLLQQIIIFDDQKEYQEKEIPLSKVIEMGKEYLSAHPLEEFLTIGQSLTNDDYATITYTSGTTADPKGVILTHRNYTANVEQSLTCVDIDDTWRTLVDNLSTSKNYVLDASPAALGLDANEYVTEFMAAFGIVPSNFRQVEAPRVDCKVLSKLTGGTQFVNTSDAGGVYNGQWIMATSRWVTRVYAPSKPLPRTGY